MNDFEVFEARNFTLQKGSALPVARLAYKALGRLSPSRDNVVVIPSWYSGTHRESELCLVGQGRVIDPDKHFVVLTNLMSGGVSSSPSNTEAPFDAARFPRVTLFDNVRLQHLLLVVERHAPPECERAALNLCRAVNLELKRLEDGLAIGTLPDLRRATARR